MSGRLAHWQKPVGPRVRPGQQSRAVAPNWPDAAHEVRQVKSSPGPATQKRDGLQHPMSEQLWEMSGSAVSAMHAP